MGGAAGGIREAVVGWGPREGGGCFGHQIVARALGAQVAPSPKGWELSVTEIELSEEGRRLFGGEKLVSVNPFWASEGFLVDD